MDSGNLRCVFLILSRYFLPILSQLYELRLIMVKNALYKSDFLLMRPSGGLSGFVYPDSPKVLPAGKKLKNSLLVQY